MRKYLVLSLVPVIFILDRITKALVIGHLPLYERIDITGFFSLVHARNFGGVFGFLQNHQYAKYIFTFFPVLIALVLVFVILRYTFPLSKTVSLALILAGALGNIYDRFAYGNVVDFLDFFWGTHHWPAFNVADISVTVGICLWLFVELFPGKKKASA